MKVVSYMDVLKKVARIIIQIIFIWGFLLIGTWISDVCHWKIPGSIIGLVLLFICLKIGIVKLKWVDAGAGFLTGELLLFFVPAAVGVVQYDEIFGVIGIKLVCVIILSTIIVMAATGFVAERFAKGDAVK